jgi:hypothetical protein
MAENRDNYNIDIDTSGWNNISAISGHTAGLKADGTVIAIGDNSHGQCDTDDWQDIIAVAVDGMQTFGLKSDGTIVAAGYAGDNEALTNNWYNNPDVKEKLLQQEQEKELRKKEDRAEQELEKKHRKEDEEKRSQALNARRKEGIVRTAKTIEEAVEIGTKDLKMNEEDVHYDVLQVPKKGFLGIGSKDAKVRIYAVDKT